MKQIINHLKISKCFSIANACSGRTVVQKPESIHAVKTFETFIILIFVGIDEMDVVDGFVNDHDVDSVDDGYVGKCNDGELLILLKIVSEKQVNLAIQIKNTKSSL